MNQLSRAVALLLGSLGCAVSVHADGGVPAPTQGRYLVVFKSATLPADAALRIASNGGAIARGFEQVGVAVARGDAGFAKRMSRDRTVLAVGVEGMSQLPETISIPLATPEAPATEGAPTSVDWIYNASPPFPARTCWRSIPTTDRRSTSPRPVAIAGPIILPIALAST